ncbi:hypothetical protein [Salinispora cortesiana]|uniref:hypothetical protein n=1 Tax=Salinispora cortesiana TaxID=1305843 RepID=UPI000470C782|nr:hypothetical protein [Salinispora cortesiana]
MVEVRHIISLSVLLSPSAPAGLQKAPGVTSGIIDGDVVGGVLVVRVAVGFGAGLVVVFDGVGFGRGLVVVLGGAGFGRGLVVVVAGVGLAEVGVGAVEVEVALIGLALVAGLVAGLSSSRAAPIPPHTHSRARKPAIPPRAHFSHFRAAAWAGTRPDRDGRLEFSTGRVCRVGLRAHIG